MSRLSRGTANGRVKGRARRLGAETQRAETEFARVMGSGNNVVDVL